MSPTSVSVLDDTGKLLSSPTDGSGGMMGVDAEQLQHVRQVEQLYSRRILDILEPIVGRQNVKAQVTAELDFSKTESTTESHKPNQSAEASAIRSQQTIESTNAAGTTPPSGVPGATTNQPPAQANAPINGAAQAPTAGGQASLAGGGKRESIVNYEVDKTIRVVKGATGMIRRINAAVVVNNSVTTNDKGKTTSTPLSAEQIDKMTALVRETVGFNKDRGDSVNLMNAAFAADKVEVVDVPMWRQPEVIDLARSFAWPVGTLLFGALVLMGVIRPAIKTLSQAPAAGAVGSNVRINQLDALESEPPERPQLGGPGVGVDVKQITASESQLEGARKLTRDNPAAVANIIKTWMNGEAPA